MIPLADTVREAKATCDLCTTSTRTFSAETFGAAVEALVASGDLDAFVSIDLRARGGNVSALVCKLCLRDLCGKRDEAARAARKAAVMKSHFAAVDRWKAEHEALRESAIKAQDAALAPGAPPEADERVLAKLAALTRHDRAYPRHPDDKRRGARRSS